MAADKGATININGNASFINNVATDSGGENLLERPHFDTRCVVTLDSRNGFNVYRPGVVGVPEHVRTLTITLLITLLITPTMAVWTASWHILSKWIGGDYSST